MVTVSTLVCAVWLTKIAREAMSRSHAQHVGVLSNTVAAALAGQMTDGWNPGVADVLRVLELDSRLAFFVLTDPQGRLVHRRLVDPTAWSTYERHLDKKDLSESTTAGLAVVLGDHDDLIVHKTPIWNPPIRTDLSDLSGRNSQRALEGFILLAVREPTLPQTLAKLQATQFIAVGVVCVLSLPVVVWVVRRWTAPVRSLLEATARLSEGGQPVPVTAKTHDELGLLADAFNTMARNLSTTRYQLEKTNEELEQKVRDRTAELERVNDRLETELIDKNDFLRAVSHDLKAPLRNIDGMAAMLLKKYRSQLAGDAMTKLERIGANVKIQTDLINDLLELSRIRNRPGRHHAIDLNELILEVRDNLSYDLEHGHIVFELKDKLPTILADQNRVRQIFQNLLDNAIKYMVPRSPSRITIEYRQDELSHHFTITDNGRGIAPDNLRDIFQMFRRATHQNGHSEHGRGVGLAIVKSIVERYGGKIDVHSQPDIGSTFHFTFDRRIVDPVVTGLSKSA